MFTALGPNQAGVGAIDGPLAVDNYKRAVYRQPPTRFVVEMLQPVKQGGSYSYGMRITPILRGDRSSTSSGGSNRSNTEYDIWRRWEDCLWFQDTLEVEYSRMARMKRQRLLAGKGVKKDGFYLQDRASSWESLPPGPEPNSVAQDVHDLVPKLTKKGTIFRASLATVEQRQAELTAFVEALFRDDVPTLLLELRSDRIVTDFFGYWRRDYDLAAKAQAASGQVSSPRNSISSSVFSSYFSSSNLNLDQKDSDTRSIKSTSPTSPSFRASRVSISTDASRYAKLAKQKGKQKQVQVDDAPRKRADSLSTLSTSSSSDSSSSRNSTSSMTSNTPGVREEVPLMFGHNPQIQSQKDRVLQSLPEDSVFSVYSDSESISSNISRRPRKRSPKDDLYRRSARLFTASPLVYNEDDPKTPTATQHKPSLDHGTNRESWQTTSSASTYLEGLDITVPSSPAQIYHRSRLSIGSIATFMTDNSADAIIPRSDIANRRLTLKNRRKRSISSFNTANVEEGPWSDGDEDVLDSYLFDAFPMPAHLFPPREGHEIGDSGSDKTESRPETPLGHQFPAESEKRPPRIPSDVIIPVSPVNIPFTPPPPPSPTASVASSAISSVTVSDFSTVTSSSATSSGSANSHIIIKVAHNKAIILLRVPNDIEFIEIRQRIRDKFSAQEKINLSESFIVAFVVPETNSRGPVERVAGASRARSNSVGGTSQMKLVTSQAEWNRALSVAQGSKITIRVLETFHD